MKQTNIKSNKAWLGILFLVYPVLSFIYGIRNFRIKGYRIFLVLFGIFYGLTYIPTEGSDAETYAERISTLGTYDFNQYWYDITHMYDVGAMYSDAYIYTAFFVISKFTSDPAVYRAVFALVYYSVFVFLLGSIYDFVRKNSKYKSTFWYFLGIVFLISLSGGINGVRFPLALHLFLLGIFLYITKRKILYLLICVLAFFVHFMMGYLLLFTLLYALTKRFYKPLPTMIIAGLFFVFAAAVGNTVMGNLGYLGGGIEERATSFTTNEDYKEMRNQHLQSVNWYIQFNRYSTYYFGIFALAVTVIFRSRIFKDRTARDLEYFALLMYIASAISGQLVDELSNRYYLIANGAFLIYLYYVSSLNNSVIFRRLLYIFIPIVILHTLIILRGEQNTFSAHLLMGNVFTEFFMNTTDTAKY